jgi:hypothetical protein
MDPSGVRIEAHCAKISTTRKGKATGDSKRREQEKMFHLIISRKKSPRMAFVCTASSVDV